jgi:hypothetical protein
VAGAKHMARFGMCFALLAISLLLTVAIQAPARANTLPDPASADVRRLVDWVIESGDTHGLPFLVVDKVNARVFAFGADGSLRGTAAVLLGLATGDVSPPGIGSRKLADISSADRITPSGRFEAHLGRDLTTDVLWVDYDAALSLHRVVKGTPAEHRAARLASPTAQDNRISYGCINVPAAFYETFVLPLFQLANGIVYILPESASGRSAWLVK